MNFLFPKKDPPQHAKNNKSEAAISIPTASSLPEGSALITVDETLFQTFKKVEEGEFDLQSLSSCVFKEIYASSVEGKSGIKERRLTRHQFLTTANTAFNNHYGFVLNPSQLFLLIVQQVALHVNQNAEALRSQFVLHEGKKELSMEIPAVPSRQEWSSIIENFQTQISNNTVPDTAALINLRDFQSSTTEEKIAGDVCLMDMCQQFFDYKVYTRCGIPHFVMEGPVEDWELLREKAEQTILRKTLPEFSRGWLRALLPTLDKLVEARRNERLDKAFWSNFYKRGSKGGSGGYTYVNGWVNAFFPLTDDSSTNPFCLPYNETITVEPSHRDGLDVEDYTSGVASAPVLWIRMGERIPMRFCAGFVGGTIVNETSLRPEVAWWVGPIDEAAEEEKKEKRSPWG